MTYAQSRKIARKTLAGLLTTELMSNQSLAQAVYDHQVGDFQGQSPVVVVYSGGSSRSGGTFQGSLKNFWLNVQVFVLYATTDGAWTEANAEDALDDISGAIFDVLDAQRVTAAWEAIEAERPSDTGSLLTISGVEYRTELIRLKVT